MLRCRIIRQLVYCIFVEGMTQIQYYLYVKLHITCYVTLPPAHPDVHLVVITTTEQSNAHYQAHKKYEGRTAARQNKRMSPNTTDVPGACPLAPDFSATEMGDEGKERVSLLPLSTTDPSKSSSQQEQSRHCDDPTASILEQYHHSGRSSLIMMAICCIIFVAVFAANLLAGVTLHLFFDQAESTHVPLPTFLQPTLPAPTRAARPTAKPTPAPTRAPTPTAAPTTAPTPAPTTDPLTGFDLVARGNGDLLGMWQLDRDHLLVVDSMTVKVTDTTTNDEDRPDENADDRIVATYKSPRQIVFATYDASGNYVVIADLAKLVTLDASTLKVIKSQSVIQACEFGVMLKDHLFVCGPSNDWDRVFTVYNVATGNMISTSGRYTYNGIPMKKVPEHPVFLTVSDDISPSKFHLYNATNGTISFIADAPYHGDFPMTNVYAFGGSPATHVITHQGIILRIFGPDNTNCVRGDCLKRDGDLGVFNTKGYGGPSYFQMTQDANGTRVFGVIGGAENHDHERRWVVQEVVIDTRAVNRTSLALQRSFQITKRKGLSLLYDSFRDSVLLGGKIVQEEKYEIRRMPW